MKTCPFYVLLIIGISFLGIIQGQAQINCPPEIVGISFPNEIFEGDRILFKANITETDKKDYLCIWEINDDLPKQTKYGNTLWHRAKNPGRNKLSLTIDCGNGFTVNKTETFTVKNVKPRIVSLMAKENEWDHYTYEFKAIAHDPGGKSRLTYEWDFGDGSKKEMGLGWTEATHRYQKGGEYIVSLTVSDPDGGITTKNEIILVEDDFTLMVKGAKDVTLSGKAAFWTGFGIEVPTSEYDKKTETIDLITKKEGQCQRGIALFDDAHKSVIILFQEGSNQRFFGTDFEIEKVYLCDKNQSPNPTNQFIAHAMIDMPEWLYRNFKASLLKLDLYEVDQENDLYEDSYGDFAQGIIKDALSMKGIFKTQKQVPWQYFSLAEGELVMNEQENGKVKGKLNFKAIDKICPRRKQKTFAIEAKGTMSLNVNYFTEQFLEECEQVEGFVVTEITPAKEQPNVSFESPEIQITFSESVDAQSINPENIQFGYLGADGTFVDEAYDFEVEGARLHIIPQSPLEPGIRYDIVVKQGPEGIRSDRGGELEKEVAHWFTTLIEPTELTVNFYQTIKNALLVPEKKTLVRTLLDWQPSEQVHESYHVKSCTFDIEYKEGSMEKELKSQAVDIQKAYSKNDIRLAKNTINYFDFYPARSRPEFEVSLTPVPQVEGREQVTFFEKRALRFYDAPKEFKVEYIPVRAFSWADSIADRYITRMSLRELAQYNTVFMEQIFPVKKVKSNVGFTYHPSIDTKKKNDGLYWKTLNALANKFEYFKAKKFREKDSIEKKFFKQYIERIGLDFLKNRLTHDYEDFTLLVFSKEGIKTGFAGRAYTMPGGDKELLKENFWDARKMKKFRSLGISVLAMDYLAETTSVTPTHEIGHGLSLVHQPDETFHGPKKKIANTPSFAIQSVNMKETMGKMNGFKLDRFKSAGWNKSDEEGNGENSEYWTLNFMHPTDFLNPKKLDENEAYFISDSQYYQLMDFLKRKRKISYNSNFSEQEETFLVSQDDFMPNWEPENTPTKEMAYVSGILSTDKKSAVVTELSYGDWPIQLMEHIDSPYQLEVFSKENEVQRHSVAVGTTLFLIDGEYLEGLTFEAFFPYDAIIDQIKFSRQGEVLADVSAPPNKPQVEIQTFEFIDNTIKMQLHPVSKDKFPLSYRVHISSDAGLNWDYLGSTSEHEFSYKLPDSSCGEHLIRIEVDALFHKSTLIRSFNHSPTFTAQIKGLDENRQNDDIQLYFSSPVLGLADLYANVQLKDLTGTEIPFELFETQEGRWFYLVPVNPLKKGKYHLDISKNLRNECGMALGNPVSGTINID